MRWYSIFFLCISLLFLIFNGTAIGFIVYQLRLGDLFGTIFFCITSLFGALCASVAIENKTSYYATLFFYCHLVVTLLPLYYLGVASIF